MTFSEELNLIIERAFLEDVRDGDQTSRACIGDGPIGHAKLLVKEAGILAGVEAARAVFEYCDNRLKMEVLLADGAMVGPGDVAFQLSGPAMSILSSERIALNIMQRMSGIASLTAQYVQAVGGTASKVIDTRKTTPGIRLLEKWAVRIGGGSNHRMGLYDMMMIKDNHIDFCGGISKAIRAANLYNEKNANGLKIEIETRNLDEVKEALECGGIDRIMLDNYSPDLLREAVELIGGRFETEASGGITLENIREYAKTGVDFISSGALTHSAAALDMSLKAVIK